MSDFGEIRSRLANVLGLQSESPDIESLAQPSPGPSSTSPHLVHSTSATPMSGAPVGMSPPDTEPTAHTNSGPTIGDPYDPSNAYMAQQGSKLSPTKIVGTGVQSTCQLVYDLATSDHPQASWCLGAILTVLRKRLTENKQYCRENSQLYSKTGQEPFLVRIEKHIKDKMRKRTIDSAAELVEQIWLGMELAQHLGHTAELAHLMRGVGITGSENNPWGETKGDHVPPPHDVFTTLKFGLRLGQQASALDTDREHEFREQMAAALSLRPHLKQPTNGTCVTFALDPATFNQIEEEHGEGVLPFSAQFNATELGREFTRLCAQHGSDLNMEGQVIQSTSVS